MNLIRNKLTVGAEKPFRFLHMSDTHFTLADKRDDLRKRELAEKRTKWHANAEQISEEAEAYARENGLMIAHTGDYIDFVSAANLDRLKWFTDENDVFLQQEITNSACMSAKPLRTPPIGKSALHGCRLA